VYARNATKDVSVRFASKVVSAWNASKDVPLRNAFQNVSAAKDVYFVTYLKMFL
jgi:hypothetical protein